MSRPCQDNLGWGQAISSDWNTIIVLDSDPECGPDPDIIVLEDECLPNNNDAKPKLPDVGEAPTIETVPLGSPHHDEDFVPSVSPLTKENSVSPLAKENSFASRPLCEWVQGGMDTVANSIASSTNVQVTISAKIDLYFLKNNRMNYSLSITGAGPNGHDFVFGTNWTLSRPLFPTS